MNYWSIINCILLSNYSVGKKGREIQSWSYLSSLTFTRVRILLQSDILPSPRFLLHSLGIRLGLLWGL